jgi:phospholipase/lecithinase/hemolysin
MRRLGLLLWLALLGSPAAHATTPLYPALYVFGDSLSDAGNNWLSSGGATPLSPPYYLGHYSNGPTWAENLGPLLGLPAPLPSFIGGTDYACGGAMTGTTSIHVANDTDLPVQLTTFRTQSTPPVPGALYALDIGSNDLSNIRANPGITAAQARAVADQAVTNATRFIGKLFGLGMRNLLLLTVADQSMQPAASSLNGAHLQAIRAMDQYYNSRLLAAATQLAAQDGFRLLVFDMYAFTDTLVANAIVLGYTNSSNACWSGDYTDTDGTLCSTTVAGQDQYVFWDHIHPTAPGHVLIAQQVLTLLQTPAAH